MGTTRKERNKQSSAFARFRDGLYAEFQRRVLDMGEVHARESLEDERKTFRGTANCSSLQKMCSAYMG